MSSRGGQRLGQLGQHGELVVGRLGVPARLVGELPGDPQPQLGRAGLGQVVQRSPARRLVQARGFGVDRAQRAEGAAVGVGQRHARVRDHAEVLDGQVVADLGVDRGRPGTTCGWPSTTTCWQKRVGQRRLPLGGPAARPARPGPGRTAARSSTSETSATGTPEQPLDQPGEPVEGRVRLGADTDPLQGTQARGIGEPDRGVRGSPDRLGHSPSKRRPRRSDKPGYPPITKTCRTATVGSRTRRDCDLGVPGGRRPALAPNCRGRRRRPRRPGRKSTR